jgi:beta-N-acetylhexosaminidase
MIIAHYSGSSPGASFLGRVQRGEIGGVIVMGDNVGPALRDSLVRLQAAARHGHRPPLLIATDQEGGQVKRLEGAPDRSAKQMGDLHSSALTYREGRQTGALLRSYGINLDLAPVVDVAAGNGAFIAQEDRAFSEDPATVSAMSGAFAKGLRDASVAATAKHFPGLGNAGANTDVAAEQVALRPADLDPYRSLLRDDRISVVMMSSAVYPRLDGARPAVLSRTAVRGLLRERLGFAGLVVTDSLSAQALRGYREPGVAAAAAGVDLLLYTGDEAASAAGFKELQTAIREGRLRASDIRESVRRIRQFKRAQIGV